MATPTTASLINTTSVKYKLAFVLIGIVCSLSVMKCSNRSDTVRLKDLPGHYAYNENPYDSIFINIDKTYTHFFQKANGQALKAGGIWRYDSAISRIFFERFIGFSNDGPTNSEAYWGPKVDPREEEIRIIYSEENRIYYYKKR